MNGEIGYNIEMFKWIDPKGETITTTSIRAFADRYGFNYSASKSLACGVWARMHGFCSTSPKVKRQRDRFMTKLVNTKTRETFVLGRSVKNFAKEHDLCLNELSKLVNGHKILYRGWCLQKTLDAAAIGHIA